ncbi:MAG TPA: pyridoxal-phosphate dependent enzyme [Phycisphaerae bacterium]|nr:pyridoxal-phosphate dependent enzyme [Phycisphaerae bacterium]
MTASALPLFEAFPCLAQSVPWTPIGHWPTPVTDARHFAEQHGLKALYVKREDLSHPQCAGNKIRGLEFILADAGRRQAETLLTFGVVGSHHICRTAWHARQHQIDTIAVVIDQPPAEYVTRNLAAVLASGTTLIPANRATLLPKLAAQFARAWIRHRRRPYVVPPGGTSPLSCLGHVNAALELKRQIEAGQLAEPDYLYVALGSLGTAAGLLTGCKLAGLKTRLVGIVASYRWYCTAARWARLARRIHRLMRRLDPAVPALSIERPELSVVTTALGDGHARPTAESLRLSESFRTAENLELDGTYTAKALHGALQFIEGLGAHDSVHLFWHTCHSMPKPAANDVSPSALPPVLRHYLQSDTYMTLR